MFDQKTDSNSIGLIEKRILYAILSLQSDDKSLFPLTNIREFHIQQRLQETFGLLNQKLNHLLDDLVKKGFLKTYTGATTGNPIYDITKKSREHLSIPPYQKASGKTLDRLRTSLSP